MKFAGQYPKEIKSLLTTSLVSGMNTILISEPGWGKTEMALTAANNIVPDGTIFIELDPSTPPEAIRGAYDPAKMLDGKLERILTGTPYDETAKVVILDEIWRANDVVFDALIHATAPKMVEPIDRPIFWGTANWVNKSERNAALRDRFALYMFLEGDLAPNDIVDQHLDSGGKWDLSWGDDMPRWEECIQIRQAIPTARSKDAVRAIVNTLLAEASKPADERDPQPRFKVNPRRVSQWAEILFRMSVFLTGKANFDDASEAAHFLKYAYPVMDKETWKNWREVTSSIANSFGSIVDSIVKECEFKATEIANSSDPASKVTSLARIVRDAIDELKKVAQDYSIDDVDPRYKNGYDRLQKVMANVLRA